jgi:hypothetical protein
MFGVRPAEPACGLLSDANTITVVVAINHKRMIAYNA